MFSDDEARRTGLYFDPSQTKYLSAKEEKEKEDQLAAQAKSKGSSGPASRAKGLLAKEGGLDIIVVSGRGRRGGSGGKRGINICFQFPIPLLNSLTFDPLAYVQVQPYCSDRRLFQGAKRFVLGPPLLYVARTRPLPPPHPSPFPRCLAEWVAFCRSFDWLDGRLAIPLVNG